MGLLNLDALAATPLATDPFDYVLLEKFVDASGGPAIDRDFPQMQDAGSFPLSELQIGPAVRALVEELDGPAFRRVVEQKFDLDLSGAPTMFTLRGHCDTRDGQIHTDSKSKIVTVLVYLNETWNADGGRLRLLRSDNLDDVVAEVSPGFGSLVMFRRSDRSWHGHELYIGPRRVLQMNWVVSDQVVAREQRRHRLSANVKRFWRGLTGAHAKPSAA